MSTEYVRVVVICDSDDDFETEIRYIPSQDLRAQQQQVPNEKTKAPAKKRKAAGTLVPRGKKSRRQHGATHDATPPSQPAATSDVETKRTADAKVVADLYALAGKPRALTASAGVEPETASVGVEPETASVGVEPDTASVDVEPRTIPLASFFADVPRWVSQGNGRGEWRRPSEWPGGIPLDWPRGYSPPCVDLTESEEPPYSRDLRRSTTAQRKVTPRFTEASWPATVIHLAANYNPQGVSFQEVDHDVSCDCRTPCRVNSCANAANYVFCSVGICPFEGLCGNGLQQSRHLTLARDPQTREYAVMANQEIGEEVVLGQYLGEIKLVGSSAHTRRPELKNNFRLLMHRDLEQTSTNRVCIDARTKGSLMRFLNHSCAPAARFRQVCNGSIHTVIVVSNRKIHAGEEVTVDYGDELWFRCHCGEHQCCHSKAIEI